MMSKNNKKNYLILINTTDSYQDCWAPFFSLFKKFWPDYEDIIYLNTEKKSFSFNGLNIISTQVNKSGRRPLTWSQCLTRALSTMKADVVLYLQEDYFLDKPVQYTVIAKLADIMKKNDLPYISLVDHAQSGPFHPPKFEDLWIIDQKSDYRISLQASLWNINKMKKYIRKHETPWELEKYGTKRANRIDDKFYTINHDRYGREDNPIISYVATGIIQGKWNRKVVPLFKEHNIKVDFNKRGFYDKNEYADALEKMSMWEKLIKRIKAIKYHIRHFRSHF